MSTFMANKDAIERKWYVIDAADKTLGEVAVAAATLLRGKHRPEFTPHVDCGEFVIVINCDKLVLTGRKLDQKKYYRHSGYVGGLKEVSARALLESNSPKMVTLAVKGMLSKNKLGSAQILRLKAYAGASHKHEAQKPEAWTL
ncbi:MAG: 50S ribosomal protein L13 [Clostridia bacterium]|nr:50S ribosomal protein L13 [Clostridia bacterium]